jgi:hypothetical protein
MTHLATFHELQRQRAYQSEYEEGGEEVESEVESDDNDDDSGGKNGTTKRTWGQEEKTSGDEPLSQAYYQVVRGMPLINN